MTTQKAPKGKRGGVRPNSGRKPSEYTKFKRELRANAVDQAEYAFQLHCDVMRDEKRDIELRLRCGDWVSRRVLGNFNQPIEVKDWREEARKQGYDPEAIFARLVAAGRAAVDAGGDVGGAASGEDSTAAGLADSGPAGAN